MLTGQIRNQVDQIWGTFWSGGISNPLTTVIEQISYLLFARWLDDYISQGVRARLRELIKFVDRKINHCETYTNFQDDVDGISEIDIVQADSHFKDYRKRVVRYIREHRDHIIIRRLKNNEPVNEADIKALEDLLFSEEAIIPREEYTRIYGDKPVGLLLRSIAGLDRNAANRAFAESRRHYTLTRSAFSTKLSSTW